jgi:hypothetical protein
VRGEQPEPSRRSARASDPPRARERRRRARADCACRSPGGRTGRAGPTIPSCAAHRLTERPERHTDEQQDERVAARLARIEEESGATAASPSPRARRAAASPERTQPEAERADRGDAAEDGQCADRRLARADKSAIHPRTTENRAEDFRPHAGAADRSLGRLRVRAASRTRRARNSRCPRPTTRSTSPAPTMTSAVARNARASPRPTPPAAFSGFLDPAGPAREPRLRRPGAPPSRPTGLSPSSRPRADTLSRATGIGFACS